MNKQKILIRKGKDIQKIDIKSFKNICIKNGITDTNIIENKFNKLLEKKDIITEKDIFNLDSDKISYEKIETISPKNTNKSIKKKKNNISTEEWLINKAENLWLYSDENNDGFIDYNEFKNNICSKYKGLGLLPENMKKLVYSEIAGEDGLISKNEFKSSFFNVCRDYINVVKAKKGDKVKIFQNKGYTFETEKNNNLVLGLGIAVSVLTGMIIMHKIQN